MDKLSRIFFSLILILSFTGIEASAFKRADKVIGGRDTTNLQHPWQVALHTRYSGHLCGASLISKRIILTAAHCVDTFGARDLRIKGQSETGEMKRLKRLPRVQEVIIHPGFDANNLASDDIAIIKLKSDVRLSDTLQPIKVIDQGFRNGLLENNFRNLPGKMMSSGWGTLEPPSRFPIHSKTLQEVDVKAVGVTKTDLVEQAFRDMLISDFNMNDEIINFIQINDSNVLLTTGEVAQTGNCMGDSGGPLVYYEQGKEPVLIGITSYAVGGEKLCLGLAGFTNIQAYGQWLKENID